MKYRLFTFTPYEYRDMEQYLAGMARDGWFLDRLGSFYMRFRKEEPGEYCFSVDIYTDIKGSDRPKSDRIEAYRQCCEDSGWSFADGYREIQVFYRPDISREKQGADTVLPIQTDEAVRRNMILKYGRRQLLGSVLFMMLGVFCIFVCRLSYKILLQNVTFLLIGGFLAAGAIAVPQSIFYAVRLIRIGTGHYRFKESKNLKGLIFRKRLESWVCGIILAAYTGLILFSGFGQMDPDKFVFGLLPLFLGIACGTVIRYHANRSPNPRSARWEGCAVTIPAVLILLFLITGLYDRANRDNTELPKVRQYSWPVVTAGEAGGIEGVIEEQISSLVVNCYYRYTEYSQAFDKAETIYIEAVNQETAEFIFKDMIAQTERNVFSGMLKKLNENLKLLTGRLYREVLEKCEPLDATVWNCEEGWRLGNNTIFLRNGAKILKLSCWEQKEALEEQAKIIAAQCFAE